MSPTGEQIYAKTYDSNSVGWTGEIAAYARWARDSAPGRPPRILELACGTGRLALALAAEGCQVTGVDSSSEMIEVARAKELNGNPTWHVGDMRTFSLGQKFDIVMVPAHSFQFMTSAADQVRALTAMRNHLEALGRLIVHLDRPGYKWMGNLPLDPPDPAEWRLGPALSDPTSGITWRRRSVWTLDPLAEVATLHSEWIQFDDSELVAEFGRMQCTSRSLDASKWSMHCSQPGYESSVRDHDVHAPVRQDRRRERRGDVSFVRDVHMNRLAGAAERRHGVLRSLRVPHPGDGSDPDRWDTCLGEEALFGSFDGASPRPDEKGEIIWIASPERAAATVQ